MSSKKIKAVVDFLFQCEAFATNPTFFTFGNMKDKYKHIMVDPESTSVARKYIDGSEYKYITFIIHDFQAISENAIPKVEGLSDENISDYESVQSIIDWIIEQDELHNFPDFGEDCIVEHIEPTKNAPDLDMINSSAVPPLAFYSIGLRVFYLDKSKMLWK